MSVTNTLHNEYSDVYIAANTANVRRTNCMLSCQPTDC